MSLSNPGIPAETRRRGPKPKVGAAEREAIVRLHADTEIPVAEIARIYRVSVRTIYSILEKMRRPRSLPGDEAEVQPTEAGVTSSEPDDTCASLTTD